MAYLFGRTKNASDLSSGTIPAARVAAASVTQHEAALEAVLDLEDLQVGDDLAMAGKKITGLGLASAATDAASKAYVDSVAQGLSAKDCVRIATSSGGDLAGYSFSGGVFTESSASSGLTLDSVALADGDRLLVRSQSDKKQNGIYVFAANGSSACTLTRAADMDADAEVTAGAYFFVEEGTYADSGWVLTSDGALTINSSDIEFTQFSGAGQITAGTGLVKSGNTLSAVGGLADIAGLSKTDGGIIVGNGSNFVLESGETARESLGLKIGDQVQAYHANLADIAGLSKTDGGIIVGDGSNFVLETGATARASLGLVIGTNVQEFDQALKDIVDISQSDGGFLVSDGTNFVQETGATARTSLGLSSMATQAKEGVDIDGGAIDGTAIGANSASTAKFTSLQSTDRIIRRVDEVATSQTVDGMGSNKQDMIVCTSSSATTLTLPASPSVGRFLTIKNFGGGAVTVAGNGNNIDGASSAVLSEQYAAIHLFYSSSSNGWVVV